MGKKMPWYAYAVGGALLAILGLYFWGKYNMKNDDKKGPTPPTPPVTENATTDKKTLAGSVFRTN
jgi:hypothetical protein